MVGKADYFALGVDGARRFCNIHLMTDKNLALDIAEVATLNGTFLLRSGQTSSTYFDKYRFESNPDLLKRVAEKMILLLPAHGEILAGLELGGVPIATAMSLATGMPAAFVRKKAKNYGTCLAVEGSDVAGKRVIIIEDIITTGGAVAEAVKLVEAAGGDVVGIVCAIWRGDGAPRIDSLPALTVSAAMTKHDMLGSGPLKSTFAV